MNQNQPASPQNIVIQPNYIGQGQQVYPVGGATPVVYAYQTRRPQVVYKDYRSCQSKFTGVVQILLGICLIAFNATALGLYTYEWHVISYGIWGGCLILVTGPFGILAGKAKSKCTVITYMVLCIVSCCMGATVFALGIVGTITSKNNCYYYYNRGYYQYYYYRISSCGDNPDAVIAMNVLLMVLGLLEAACALWGSIICCRSACCGNSGSTSNQQTGTPIQFAANNGTPVILIGNSQIAGYPMAAGQIVTASMYPANAGQIIAAPGYPVNGGQILTAPIYQANSGQMMGAPAYAPTVGHIVTAPAYQTTAGQIITAPPYETTLGHAVPPYEATANTAQHGTDMSEEKTSPADHSVI